MNKNQSGLRIKNNHILINANKFYKKSPIRSWSEGPLGLAKIIIKCKKTPTRSMNKDQSGLGIKNNQILKNANKFYK